MRIVMLSDTHGLHHAVKVPEGDVLIHAGDSLRHGSRLDLLEFLRWFATQPHKHKLLIAGNHDWAFEKHPDYSRAACKNIGVTYLQDSGVTIDGLNFWGMPWMPEFCGWAFMLPSPGPEMTQKCDYIPAQTNVLITHAPPHGTLDRVVDPPHFQKRDSSQGCQVLARRLGEVRPRIHVFGHIHEGYGIKPLVYRDGKPPTICFNASVCNVAYEVVNGPHVVDYGTTGGG